MIVHNFGDYPAYEHAYYGGKGKQSMVIFDCPHDREEIMRWWWIQYGSILTIRAPHQRGWQVLWRTPEEITWFMLRWS